MRTELFFLLHVASSGQVVHQSFSSAHENHAFSFSTIHSVDKYVSFSDTSLITETTPVDMLTIKDYSARFDECQQKYETDKPVDNLEHFCYDYTRKSLKLQ